MPAAASAPAVALDVIAGPDAGRHLVLAPGRHVVGRAHRSVVRLDDPAVEAHHALVTVDPAGVLSLVQLAGRRPVLVDGTPVVAGEPVPIAHSIEIGDSALRRPEPTLPPPEVIRPVALPAGLRPDDLDGVLAFAARVRRAGDLARGGVVLGVGEVRLPIELTDLDGTPLAPDLTQQPIVDRHERHPAHPVRMVLDGATPAVVGLLTPGRDPALAAARQGVVRSVIAQLGGAARRRPWTVAAALDGRTAPAVERLADRPGPVLLVTDRALLVDELLRRCRGRDAPTAALLLIDAASPAVSRCTATLRVGPRWRGVWTPDVREPAEVVRVHLRGHRPPGAERLAAA